MIEIIKLEKKRTKESFKDFFKEQNEELIKSN